MKRLALSFFAILLGFSLFLSEAEAKRLGGGRSIGMQRAPVTQPARQNAMPHAPVPQQAQPGLGARPAPGVPPAAQPSGWRKWAAPLAGLAAGIGLAALLSHLGIGGEFAGLLLIALAAFAAFALYRRFGRGASPSRDKGMQYAGAGAPYSVPLAADTLTGAGAAGGGTLASGSSIPAGFDAEGFVRTAKVNFIRMQAAHDEGNLDDIREFTSPEMFAELKLDIDARAGRRDKTDVVALNADLLDVSQEASRFLASVRFHGLLREDPAAAPAQFDEVWHLAKPLDGSRGWILAGIEQLQ